MVFAFLGIVLDWENMLASNADAAHELVPRDELLDDHREHATVVVVVDQLLERVADIYIAPAAAVRVLEDARQANVGDDAVPVERIDQVAQ